MTQPQYQPYRTIPLTQGQYALVDESDYEYLNQWKWFAQKDCRSGAFYAVREAFSQRYGIRRRQRAIRMHRQIAGDPEGMVVDHLDHNTLNNQRHNLRIATHSENSFNVRKSNAIKSSQYKGVSWWAAKNRWRVMIMAKGKSKYIGRFRSEEDAARAYNEAAIKMHGEFACVNVLD